MQIQTHTEKERARKKDRKREGFTLARISHRGSGGVVEKGSSVYKTESLLNEFYKCTLHIVDTRPLTNARKVK